MAEPNTFNIRKYFPVLKFLIIGLLLYLGWAIIYETLIKPNHWIDPWLTNIVSNHSALLLRLMGYDVSHRLMDTGNTIFNGTETVLRIAYFCDGLILYVVFIIFMIAFPGPFRNKWWYIPAGMAIIYMVNLLRVIGLVLIQIHAPSYLDFNHKYTFTLIVYLVIFLLWLVWIRYFTVRRSGES